MFLETFIYSYGYIVFMRPYKKLFCAAAIALSGCQKPEDDYGSQADAAAKTPHYEIAGIVHLSSNKIPSGTRYVAIICGQPYDSARTTNFLWMKNHNKKVMSFYHVLPDEPAAKQFGLSAGQTLIYKNGKEVCRSNSTFCEDLVGETGYHAGDTDIPPPGCKDGLVAGKKAPDFNYVDFRTQEKLSLRSLEGKVVLLDFWATWCKPCIRLQPHLEKIAKKYLDVRVIGVSVDSHPGQLVDYLEKKNVGYSVVNDPLWEESTTVKSYGVVGIPDVFLIDKKGFIAGRNLHFDYEKFEFDTSKLEAKIEEVLKK